MMKKKIVAVMLGLFFLLIGGNLLWEFSVEVKYNYENYANPHYLA